ncbi:MAG: RNA-binding protein [Candidatus Poribacteria bacterium]|nr:MAG: RNA-binding protein [Candidatus Poribacteria bacterium]
MISTSSSSTAAIGRATRRGGILFPDCTSRRGDRWVDRTEAAGLAFPVYGLGVAVGDYDNDGDPDLYLTALGPDRLLRNNGDGTFTEVTHRAGIANPEFASSAAWFDADNDGWLDLYVANYVQWSPETDIFCSLDGVTKSYCTPEPYRGVSDRFYRNNGDGTFTDATEASGLYDPTSKSLGVVAFDYNLDGAMDLFVANDTEPDKLFENLGNGTFAEVGMLAGVAFDENGVARAGMGVDVGDVERSGHWFLAVTNFSNEMISLYRSEGNGLFIDRAQAMRIGPPSLPTLGFGCFFFDADGDGWLDLFAVNGHVEPEIERVQPTVAYRQRPHLFWNREGRVFVDVAEEAGFTAPLVGRGAAYGDLDGDGDLDVVITENGGPARIYRNDSERGALLRVRLVGRRSNRDAIGAMVRVTANGLALTQMVRGGGSYCSQSEYTLTFGLGEGTVAQEVLVRFPKGTVYRLNEVPAEQTLVVDEERGVVQVLPFRSKGAKE